MRIPSGKVDQSIYFVGVDPTDLKTRETGLTTFTVYRSRNGAAEVAYTTPTVTEIDATNMPGVYALLIDEDTTIASTSDSEEYCVHITQASMAPVTRTFELYRRSVTSGQTVDVSSGGVEVGSFQANAITAAALAADAAGEIADAVWDETLTTNNHNGSNSAGRRLRTLNADVTIFAGTATAGSTNTITAPSTASTVDDVYVGATVTLTGGTGVGQTRRIINYVGSTKVITVDRNWAVNPANGTTFDILAGAGSPIAVEGTIASATGTTAVLGTEASSTDDIYLNGIITITSGTGAGQYRDVTDYVGSTKTVTVDTWTQTPDSTSGYAIIPSGAQADTGGGTSAPTAAEVAAAVLTTAMTEGYSTDGGTVTLAQGLYELLARDQESAISGTTMTVKKRDGSTTAYTLTLNDADNPTSVTRAS